MQLKPIVANHRGILPIPIIIVISTERGAGLHWNEHLHFAPVMLAYLLISRIPQIHCFGDLIAAVELL